MLYLPNGFARDHPDQTYIVTYLHFFYIYKAII